MSNDMSTTFHRSPGWWYAHPETSGDHLIVLNALMLHADTQTFTCFPSQKRIGDMLKRSRAWVNRVIRELSEIGLIQKSHRTRDDHGMSSCEYRIVYHDPRSEVPAAVDKDSEFNEISAVTVVTGGVKDDDTNKTQTNKYTLSEISIEDWKPKTSTLKAMTASVGDAAAGRFVARFRRKVAAKGYQYPDFDVAILEWFEADRLRGLVSQPGSGQSRRKATVASSPRSDPAPSLEEYMEAKPEIGDLVKQTVREALAGKLVRADIDLETRFQAACLHLAHSKNINLHTVWFTGMRSVGCDRGILRLSQPDRVKREHVEKTFDSSLTASCIALGIDVNRIKYEA